MTKNVPYLTGGIFFSLLLPARKPRQKARDKLKGGTDNLREIDLMHALNYVLTGDDTSNMGNTIKKATSNYKQCSDFKSVYIELDNFQNVSTFASNKNNLEILSRISRLINNYLGTDKRKWLTKVLLETIILDIEISDTEHFDIDINQEIEKKNFPQIEHVCLPIFLFSILRFILKNRTDNSLGRPTFLSWHSKSSQGIWKFNNDALGNRFNSIQLTDLSEDDINNMFNSSSSQMNVVASTKPIDDEYIQNTLEENKQNTPQVTNNFFNASNGGVINLEINNLEISNNKPLVPIAQARYNKYKNTITISGVDISIPISISPDANISSEDEKYVQALYELYSEITNIDITSSNINSLLPNLKNHYETQNKSYFALEQKQRAIRDVFDDGEYQMEILKEDAFSGIEMTYLNHYTTGLERLNAILEKITTITLDNSTLKNIIGLIGNLEKRGICHVLVNDNVIRSWVTIDE
ncbi:ABC-three component system protein [Gemella sp. zg-1178]|uniref:ABC-three component system protein n=1 Tax=Gemella sp. zg-1178 TaxID=2840372 RepID=UPI001C05956D|nr:ABC-three component system protein [Gemella sp. zg-1178]MBU0278738.1 hypothetical protein [Gemella sp. zg-1178]